MMNIMIITDLPVACLWTQVTFFWNGNRSGYFDEGLETYVEIPSDQVPFNQAPDMKAREITAAGKEALMSGKYDMVRINYANPGARHIAHLERTPHACACVAQQVFCTCPVVPLRHGCPVHASQSVTSILRPCAQCGCLCVL